MTDPYAALRQCVEALERALPIVQYDAQMMADITRHSPLPPEDQAKHDSTEYDSEKLVREIPTLITAARAALDARQGSVGWVPTGELHAMQTGYSQSVSMRSSRLTATSAYRPQDVVTLYVGAPPTPQTQRLVRLTDGVGRCANAPACGCREAEQQCAARMFARREQRADRWREIAKAAGWKDTPTVRQAFYCFNISDFAARVAQAESERYAPLMQAVEWILEDGHMNQEHLARLRAAFEAA